MSQLSISKRYAKALLDIALDQKRLDQMLSDMTFILETVNRSPELVEWMLHPTTDIESKKEVIKKLFKKTDKVVLHFLYVLIDNHRMNILQEVVEEFHLRVNEVKGEVQAKVMSSFPLTKSDRKELINTFHPILGKEMVIQEEVVDSDLLGGVIVKIGDRIYDGSLKTRLIRFEERVKKMRTGS